MNRAADFLDDIRISQSSLAKNKDPVPVYVPPIQNQNQGYNKSKDEYYDLNLRQNPS